MSNKNSAPTGSEQMFNRHLPAAQKLAKASVRPMRVDLALALSNAAEGTSAVLEHEGVIRQQLPQVSVAAIEGLPDLGSAVSYAAGQINRYAPAPTDTKELLKRAHDLRGLLLSTADALVRANIFPSAAVVKIHQGHGGIDTAGDCVALAALFQKHAKKIKGKVPVTAADVKECAGVGTTLLGVLRPKAAGKKPPAKDLTQATDARDRLWTLFETSWEDNVWRAGAYLFKRRVDLFVPPLHSRVVGKRPPKPAPAPTPAASP